MLIREGYACTLVTGVVDQMDIQMEEVSNQEGEEDGAILAIILGVEEILLNEIGFLIAVLILVCRVVERISILYI